MRSGKVLLGKMKSAKKTGERARKVGRGLSLTPFDNKSISPGVLRRFLITKVITRTRGQGSALPLTLVNTPPTFTPQLTDCSPSSISCLVSSVKWADSARVSPLTPGPLIRRVIVPEDWALSDSVQTVAQLVTSSGELGWRGSVAGTLPRSMA